MAYVYRHIRLDTQMPFYVGASDKPDIWRSRVKYGKKPLWHEIVNSVGYEVEIIMDGLTKEQVFEKEREFIKIYGRIDLGTGTLVNITDGGKGMRGWVASEETRKRYSASSTGRKQSLEIIRKRAEKNKKSICQYSLDGQYISDWDSAATVEKKLNINRTNICSVLKGKRKWAGGFIFKYKNK